MSIVDHKFPCTNIKLITTEQFKKMKVHNSHFQLPPVPHNAVLFSLPIPWAIEKTRNMNSYFLVFSPSKFIPPIAVGDPREPSSL